MLRSLLLLPLCGAFVVALLPRRQVRLIHGVALFASISVFIRACFILNRFDTRSGEIQLFESHPWHGRLGSAFSLGIDGLSFPLILLATLLVLVAILASRTLMGSMQKRGQAKL